MDAIVRSLLPTLGLRGLIPLNTIHPLGFDFHLALFPFSSFFVSFSHLIIYLFLYFYSLSYPKILIRIAKCWLQAYSWPQRLL